MVKRRKQIFENPAKILYEGPEPDSLVQYFREFDLPGGTGDGRGVINNRVSEHFYLALNEIGLPNHFMQRLNMREQLVRGCEYLPVSLMIRNVAAGALSRRLGIKEGEKLNRPVVELNYNDLRLADPLVTEEHIANFGWIMPQDLDEMLAIATRTHDLIAGMLMSVGYTLVDLRLEFGRQVEQQVQRTAVGEEIREDVRVILASDLSVDMMRLLDRKSGQMVEGTGFEPWRQAVLSKDPAPRKASAHQEVAARLGILPQADIMDLKGPATLQ